MRESGESGTRVQASLLLLVVINLFNYIDRQVLAAVEPEIRRELEAGLGGASDGVAGMLAGNLKFWMGLLSTAFLVAYMLIAPLFGTLADRHSRWKLVGIGVVVWSLASGASGIDWGLSAVAGYFALLSTRAFVGVGEGAYGPVAPAMIADLFPRERRGQVMSLFYLAIPVGGALGYAFGELVKNWLGWRWAFYLVVPPGLLLGWFCFRLPDPPRSASTDKPLPVREAYATLLRIPSFVINTLGMTAMTFAIGALAYWMPAFLEEREAPALFGIPPRTSFGAITALAGLLATLAGGWAGDALRARFSGSYFLVSGVAMLIGAPMVLGFLYAPFPLAWVFVFAAVFCLFFNTGPTNTILANVTKPSMRATAFALNILIIHLFGDAISPPIVGWLSDRYGRESGFWLVSIVAALGGLIWLCGAATLERDSRAASEAAGDH